MSTVVLATHVVVVLTFQEVVVARDIGTVVLREVFNEVEVFHAVFDGEDSNRLVDHVVMYIAILLR